MKIAIITWFNYKNFGTALQVSALYKTISDEGHFVDVINYLPRSTGGSLVNYSPYLSIKMIKYKFNRIFEKQRNVNDLIYVSNTRNQLFDDYLTERITFTKTCETLSDLENLNSEYDAFVCGSDQIWAPSVFDPHYFLDFVNNNKKKIAYAPSIGLPKIKDRYVSNQMTRLIKNIEYLSVREEEGSNTIKKLIEKKPFVSADPTLLINKNQWLNYCNINETINNNYILVYMLGDNGHHWEEINKIAKIKKLELKIIPVFAKDKERKGCVQEEIGPKEFVNYIANSEYVITDSYHGMLFAIQFNKQFSIFERFNKSSPINQNSRINNILKKFNLQNRLISYDGKYNNNNEIDYSVVNNELLNFVDESKSFLFNSLNEIKNTKTKKTINRVTINNSVCCGCGSCSIFCPNNAIKVEKHNNGFIYAYVEESKCINCGLCIEKCPLIGINKAIKIEKSSLYSYKDYDNNVLKKSSSGGFAYRLSEILIEKGYAVAGCTFDSEEKEAKHILITNKNDLHLLQSSKYMQSDFVDCLKKIYDYKKPVAIFGTPCQIAGAKKLLFNRNDILYIDLICHGVPTYNLYTKYLDYLNKKYKINKKQAITIFRDKRKDWRKKYIYTFDNTKEVSIDEENDLYLKVFETMNAYMKSCYDCRFRDCSVADLRIGDYWGPKFIDDKQGVSMITCLNDKGEELLNLIRKYCPNSIQYQPIEDYFKYQQNKNITIPLYYDEMIENLANKKMNIEKIVDKYVNSNEIMNSTYKILFLLLGKNNYNKLKKIIRK